MAKRKGAGTAVGVLGLAQGFVGIAVGYLPTNPNEGLAKWLFVGAAICVVVAAGFFVWPDKTENDPTISAVQSGSRNVQITGEIVNFTGSITTGAQQIATGRLSDGRVVVDVTPHYLSGLFDHHTDIQASRLTEAYVGKWLRLTAEVDNVTSLPHGESAFISTAVEKPHVTIHMIFEGADVVDNQLRVLRKGDHVTVVGKIERVLHGCLDLNDCELEAP